MGAGLCRLCTFWRCSSKTWAGTRLSQVGQFFFGGFEGEGLSSISTSSQFFGLFGLLGLSLAIAACARVVTVPLFVRLLRFSFLLEVLDLTTWGTSWLLEVDSKPYILDQYLKVRSLSEYSLQNCRFDNPDA